jgi:hypothetical protein
LRGCPGFCILCNELEEKGHTLGGRGGGRCDAMSVEKLSRGGVAIDVVQGGSEIGHIVRS